MAASVKVSASGNQITVEVKTVDGSGYDVGSANVQVTNNTTGATVPSSGDTTTDDGTTSTRTVTYSATPGGYVVLVNCGGEAVGSSVTTGTGTVNIR